jgi:hypothetical protein
MAVFDDCLSNKDEIFWLALISSVLGTLALGLAWFAGLHRETPTVYLLLKLASDLGITWNWVWRIRLLGTTVRPDPYKAFCYLADIFQKMSLLWYLVLVYDVQRTIDNPLSESFGPFKRYCALVVCVAVGMVALASSLQISWFCDGDKCFSDVFNEPSSARETFLYFYPSLVLVCSFGSMLVWWRVNKVVKQGFQQANNSAMRYRVLKQGLAFGTVFVLYYILYAAKFGIDIYSKSFSSSSDNIIKKLIAPMEIVFLPLYVLTDLAALLYTTPIFTKALTRLRLMILRWRDRPLQLQTSDGERIPILSPNARAPMNSRDMSEDALADLLRQEIRLWIALGLRNSLNHHTDEMYSLAMPPRFSLRKVSFAHLFSREFAETRELCGISRECFDESFSLDLGSDALHGSFSPGKSDSFMFVAKHFVIKTVTKEELAVLRELVPHYVEYLRHYPASLIVRLYGLHELQYIEGKPSIFFVVMERLGAFVDPTLTFHRRYDLKGSTENREETSSNPDAVLKDVNFVKNGEHFNVGSIQAASLRAQLRLDADFLRDLGIMDFSLLALVHSCSPNRRVCSQGARCPFGGGYACPAGSLCPHKAGQGQSFTSLVQSGIACRAGASCGAAYNRRLCAPSEQCTARGQCEAGQPTCPEGPACPVAHTCTLDARCRLRLCANASCPSSVCRHAPLTPSDDVLTLDQLRCGFRTVSGPPGLRLFAIIDILQKYSLSKRGERVAKRMTGRDPRELSCVPPPEYAARFKERLCAYFS